MTVGRLADSIKSTSPPGQAVPRFFMGKVSSIAGGRIQINNDTSISYRRLVGDDIDAYAVDDLVLGVKWGHGQACILGVVDP